MSPRSQGRLFLLCGRATALALAVANVTTGVAVAAPPTFHRVPIGAAKPDGPSLLDQFATRDGRTIQVLEHGFVSVQDKKSARQSVRYIGGLTEGSRGPIVPDHDAVLAALSNPTSKSPYVSSSVVVVLKTGTSMTSDDVRPSATSLASMHRSVATLKSRVAQSFITLSAQKAVFPYSNDARLNQVLTKYAIAESHRLFKGATATRVQSMEYRAKNAASLLPVQNTYRLTVTNGAVRDAVTELRSLPTVAYASPEFRATTMNAPAMKIPSAAAQSAKIDASKVRMPLATRRKLGARQPNIPSNYTVAHSGQSMLDASGVNAIAAYDEIATAFGQLPGTGEIITNVSIGDLDDASAQTNQNDPCYLWFASYNVEPTTKVINGQRYLDLPSMPLIPTYTADTDGHTNPVGEVCGSDPSNGEINLDFSMMAPLPHNLQRPSAQGIGFSDLLGIAPGAQYRLVVPQNPSVGASDIAGALLGAALQQPAPNVITASLGWGMDGVGFPSRYLEEDPLIRSVVAAIVAQGIVVCISSGDGLRTYTNAAVNPSGGAVPINVIQSGSNDLSDEAYSSIPSAVADTGSIAVGGTTLNDVTAAPPYEAQFAQYRDQLAFPETRWTGFGSLASGFGPRVNISAPSDNVLVTDQNSIVNLSGGTSASAPEVAAAAAIALQVARLTGKPFTSATAVRDFLVAHADPVPNVPQADQTLTVGPQLNVGHVVEALLDPTSAAKLQPSVGRVAIAHRQPVYASDFAFITDTDPTAIDLTGARTSYYSETGFEMYQPITIAPDWENLPAHTQFALYVSGSPAKTLSTKAFARLYPTDLLNAAGLPLFSAQSRTVNLTYAATLGLHTVAQTSIAITILPNTQEMHGMGPAPFVAPVTSGKFINVTYDISNVDLAFDRSPTLLVSTPGRTSTAQPGYHALYKASILQPKGTIQVPVSALQGDGMYGIAIGFLFTNRGRTYTDSTTWAYTRVATAGSFRPNAPLLSLVGATNVAPAHYLDVPLGSSFQVSWDVSKTSGATGAILEISAPGPTGYSNYATFNNPNGSIVDHNGIDSGSQYTMQVGVTGTVTIPASQIASSQFQTVRVIPVSFNGAAGEASDVSTIATHGIMSADGGIIAGGFSVNTNGSDGLLTSNQPVSLPNGASMLISSVQAFNQVTNTVGNYVANNEQTFSYWNSSGMFDNYFNVWGSGIDPATDSAYFVTHVAYSQNCAPYCTNFARKQINWEPTLNLLATGQKTSLDIWPSAVPNAPDGSENLNYALVNGELLRANLYNSQRSAPTINQVIPAATQWSSPTFGPTYSLNNLLQNQVVGIASGNGYAVALGEGNGNMLDVVQTSTGNEHLLTLNQNNDAWFWPSSVAIDGQAAYFATTSFFWPYPGFLSVYGISPYSSGTGTGQTLASYIPLAMADVGNGWVAILSQLAPDWRTNDNTLAAVELVNIGGQTPQEYVLETSWLGELYSYMGTSAGLPPFNNLIQANPNTKTIYVIGPSGSEIQVIPVAKFGVNL